MDKFKGLRLKWQDDIKLDKGHTLQEVVGKDSQVKNKKNISLRKTTSKFT